MNVGELKKILEQLPDDAPVLKCGSDHSPVSTYIFGLTVAALQQGGRTYYTDDVWDKDELIDEKEYGVRIPALVFD